MMFTNLQLYRISGAVLNLEVMRAAMEAQKFTPCGSNELERTGWISPRNNGDMIHALGRQYLLALRTESKMMPSAVVNQLAEQKAKELEEIQGFRPGRKAFKELKERAFDELLPRAFSKLETTRIWIDAQNDWLVVDSASAGKADHALRSLLKTFDKLPVESLRVQRSPVAAMTAWLETDEAPLNFTVDQDTELRSTGASKAAVRYVNHALEVDDVRRHIAAGKQCTRLAMTWNDKISFTLHENLAIKSVKPLDVLRETDSTVRNDVERFDNDFTLMSGEYARMLSDLVEALGGLARA